MSSVIKFFQDGGFFLYPLVIIFVVGVVIAIERWIYLTKETMKNRNLWDDVAPHLGAGNFKQAIALANNSQAQIGTDDQVVQEGIRGPEERDERHRQCSPHPWARGHPRAGPDEAEEPDDQQPGRRPQDEVPRKVELVRDDRKNRLEPGSPWRPARPRNWLSMRRDSCRSEPMI